MVSRKVSKKSVNYRQATVRARRCGTCSMFRRVVVRGVLSPGRGSCTLVEGYIRAREYVRQMGAQTMSAPTDGYAGLIMGAAIGLLLSTGSTRDG